MAALRAALGTNVALQPQSPVTLTCRRGQRRQANIAL